MLKKIWKDSVGSKIIAAGIIALITFSYLKFESYSEKITLTEAYNKVVSYKVSLFYVLIVALLVLISTSVIKKLLKNQKGLYNKKQKELRKFNKTKDSETDLLFKWIVYFKQNGTPFIADLTAFCTKHEDAPLKLINGNCPIYGCENHKIRLDSYGAKNHIESVVINKWDKLNQ